MTFSSVLHCGPCSLLCGLPIQAVSQMCDLIKSFHSGELLDADEQAETGKSTG